jgi:hypothetical protein
LPQHGHAFSASARSISTRSRGRWSGSGRRPCPRRRAGRSGDGVASGVGASPGDAGSSATRSIPGWDHLVTIVEREFGSEPSLFILRTLRGRASEVLDIPIGAVNDLTILQVVEALDEANRAPTAITATTDSLLDEYRWLKVTQIARLFALNAGQVSKLADSGTIASNGKSGNERRIDVLSVIKRELGRLDRDDRDGI